MGRIARRIDKEKIARLQVQIDDPRYLSAAVEGLAARITDRIVRANETLPSSYLSMSTSSNLEALLRVLEE